MTNAVKAGIITLVNAVLAGLPMFGVPLSNQQSAAIGLVVNSALALVVLLTYKDSPKRVPDTP